MMSRIVCWLLLSGLMHGVAAADPAAQEPYDATISAIGALQLRIAQMPGAVEAARQGDSDAHDLLATLRTEGSDKMRAALATPLGAEHVARLQPAWDKLETRARQIIAQRDALVRANQTAMELAAAIPAIQVKYDEIAQTLRAEKSDTDGMYLVTRQMLLLARLASAANTVVHGDATTRITVTDRMARDAKMVTLTAHALVAGDDTYGISKLASADAAKLAAALAPTVDEIAAHVETLIGDAAAILEVDDAADLFGLDARYLITDLEQAKLALSR
jgi:hypothetical protein